MPTLYVPTIMRKFTNGQSEVKVASQTVGELIDTVESQHPGIRNQLVDAQGKLHKHVRIFVNDEDIGHGEWAKTGLHERDNVLIVTAMAGG